MIGSPQPQPFDVFSEGSRPQGPPGPTALLGELRAAATLPRLLAAAPWLARAPRGHGQTVIDLPGWQAPEISNLPLRAFLRQLGYVTRSWGLGTNTGSAEADAEKLADQLTSDPDGPPVALVGWSLGGTIAREIARSVPERVACVITYGSPVIGGPTHTIGARSAGPDECARIDGLIQDLDASQPIRVPITAMFTRRDGIVDWRACIDRFSPHVEHVEVRSTHLSLGIDPDVWWTVAQALSRHHP
jgi:pimeloyl-ACP methyl ester carboxylesterase